MDSDHSLTKGYYFVIKLINNYTFYYTFLEINTIIPNYKILL